MTSIPRPVLRPSFSSQASFAISTRSAEDGDPPHNVTSSEQLEELEAIKRYEDFTTIDWVQDAERAQQLRRAQRRKPKGLFFASGTSSVWRRKLAESYEAGQAWIVVSLIGACIGLNAAFLNIITEWLSDIKLGYCATGFYLNQKFCCWGAEETCADWHYWSSFGPINYLTYVLFSMLFAFTAAFLVKSYAPYAAGSGISEIKCIIAGFVMKGFLGFWTLLIKSLGLPLSISSGLSVGKEGPSVHYAVATGYVVSRFFDKYKKSAAKTRELLCACAASGVAVAFGSPIGGVLFSLEEMSSNFPLKTMWRSFFCALVATAVLAAMNPFRTGQLVMFQVHYDRDWHFFEVIFFIILGIFGGLYGEFTIKWNLRAQAFRKRYLSKYQVQEATVLAALTAIVCYFNRFLRIDMTESMEILFHECEPNKEYGGLCEAKHRWHMVFSLVLATIIRIFFVLISYGCKVPAGIFVPSMAIGATFGRMVGIMVQALHETYPKSAFFSSCQPDVPCITPGTYAFLGAAAALSGIMHITVSVVVIMFELTGALTYILPTMIVVGVTKIIGERFGKGGIADRMITFSGFPFLDSKEEHSFGVPVSTVMIQDLIVLPSSGLDLGAVERLLESTTFRGFPVVQDKYSRKLLGYISRVELRYAIDRAQRNRTLPPTAKCYFSAPPTHPSNASTSLDSRGAQSIDFAPLIDPTPLTVHPRLPLETVMEIFQKLGPRVVLVEHRGKLRGMVTVKDCLKYKHANEEREGWKGEDEWNELAWRGIVFAGKWIKWVCTGMRGLKPVWAGSRRYETLGDDDDGEGELEMAGGRQ